jgi:2-dehydro-3-deoxygluconokinase
MNKVFCFGEILLRMSPMLQGEWMQQANMPVYIGGAELNVATALAMWNIPVKYCTAMPNNYLSKEIIEVLSHKKIDTSPIHFTGDRMGIYYLPQGVDLKSAGVIYDRAHSSFAALQPGMIDWNEALKDCNWFHFSAISPALNNHTAAVCKEALQAAAAKGLTISIDLNYRNKLWQYKKKPVEIMRELLQYCTIVMGNIWAAESLLGIALPITDSTGKTKNELLTAAGKSMLELQSQYPQVTTMAYTFRMEENYFGVLQHGAAMAVSNEYPLKNPVDKAGSGDCFMGGLIYGLTNKMTEQQIIDFAAAAAVGKMQEKGDSTQQTIAQINAGIL